MKGLLYELMWTSTREDRYEGIMHDQAEECLVQRGIKILDEFGGAFATGDERDLADNGYVVEVESELHAQRLQRDLSKVLHYAVTMEQITGARAFAWRHPHLHYLQGLIRRLTHLPNPGGSL